VISQSQYEESGEDSRVSQWLAVRNGKESRKVLQSARNANMGLGGRIKSRGESATARARREPVVTAAGGRVSH